MGNYVEGFQAKRGVGSDRPIPFSPERREAALLTPFPTGKGARRCVASARLKFVVEVLPCLLWLIDGQLAGTGAL